ncbi:MCM2/3/5 family-domain-containing protein [Lactarius pseudohatsudake]|nr:MCM2/3/5 family-domain-containing protein [Lactarius pseudohatsudake]
MKLHEKLCNPVALRQAVFNPPSPSPGRCHGVLLPFRSSANITWERHTQYLENSSIFRLLITLLPGSHCEFIYKSQPRVLLLTTGPFTLYGRYNPKVSPIENVNLPTVLLSRFDLLFLLLYKPSRDDDEQLAQRATHVHMYNGHLEYEPLEPALMRYGTPLHHLPTHSRLTSLQAFTEYISPSPAGVTLLSPDVSSYIVDSYVRLCKQSKDDVQRDRSRTHVCARTLLGVQRLAQALARLRFAAAVLHADVDEALRLMAASKESLHDDDGDDADARDADRPDTNRIYRIIKDMAQATVAVGTGRGCGSARADSSVGRITNAMCKTRKGRGGPSGRALDGGHSCVGGILRHS